MNHFIFCIEQILGDDENEGDLDEYQPKEVKEEYIQKEERKLGKNRVSYLLALTSALSYLLTQLVMFPC